jgi:MFS family permease
LPWLHLNCRLSLSLPSPPLLVFAYFVPELGANFFSTVENDERTFNTSENLVESFFVVACGFYLRPLGALVFGHIGDQLGGRRRALLLSMIVMCSSSIAIGFLPTYSQVGNLSTVLLIIARLCQGFSVGGQLAGSYVLTIEECSAESRGYRGAVCDASTVSGFLLASLVTLVVRNVLSEEAVTSWGWR